jgi:hypothetical protein
MFLFVFVLFAVIVVVDVLSAGWMGSLEKGSLEKGSLEKGSLEKGSLERSSTLLPRLAEREICRAGGDICIIWGRGPIAGSSFEIIARAGEVVRPILVSPPAVVILRSPARLAPPDTSPPILPRPLLIDLLRPVPLPRPPDSANPFPSNDTGLETSSTQSLESPSSDGLSLPVLILFKRPLNAEDRRSPPHVPLLIFEGGRYSLSLSLSLSLARL